MLEGIFNRITPNADNRNAIVGVGTGYTDLDAMTGGFQRSDLIILAARPSMGKTAFALGITHGAALLHGKTVGIFSMEMSAEQLAYRLLSTETGIDSHRLRLGQVDDHEWERLSRALGRLSEAKIYIDDTAGAGIMEVRSKARRLMSEQGLDMIVVDYLQLMSSGRRNDNRVQEIAEISRGLKGLARELNVPVVALSQLSRAVETRSDHRPMLSDLRESGSIEQDADLVMFIYREEKYDEETDKRGIAEIILAKHRNGPVGSINLRFFEQTGSLRRPRGPPGCGPLAMAERFGGFIVETDPSVPIPHAFFTDLLPSIAEPAELHVTLAMFRLVHEAGGFHSPVAHYTLLAGRQPPHGPARAGQPQRTRPPDHQRDRPVGRSRFAAPLHRAVRAGRADLVLCQHAGIAGDGRRDGPRCGRGAGGRLGRR